MAASLAVGPGMKDFIFTEKLGSGTYATVYKAYRKGHQREVVAVKCVEKSSLNRLSTENLLTEIELLKTLKNEHIVQLKDFQWDDKYIYLIMEYCSGGDLSRFIKTRRTLSEHTARRFFQQLAMALQYMRSKKVAHLDLKPQNILLSSPHNPKLKVADFGFAHYLKGTIEAVILRGSPLYMAPEIVIRRYYNEKADLWSVGVILHECLFGRAPFASRTIQELEDKIKDTRPVELPYGVEISDQCRELLLGLLKREPDMRMSFEEFFSSPFIDLDHAPSSTSFDKAIKLTREAVQCDSKGEFKSAVALYCQALEHFVPAIHYESDPQKKATLRKKVQEYIDRAEQLKELLKPKPRTRVGSGSVFARSESNEASEHLYHLSEYTPEMNAALKKVFAAALQEEREDYAGALKTYEDALEALLKVLHDEPKGRRRDLLQKEIERWMSRAEEIKVYLKVNKLQARDTSKQEELEDSEVLSQCVLQ